MLHMAGPLPHHTLKRLADKHGALMHLQLGEISAIVVSSPRLAEEVMKTRDLSFASRPKIVASEILSYNSKGLAFAPYGDYWRQMRKIATLKLLSSKKVQSFHSVWEEEIRNLIGSISHSSSSSSSPVVNLTEFIFSFINSIVCRTMFGERCKEQVSLLKSMKEATTLAGGFDVADLFPSFKFLHLVSGIRPKLEKLQRNTDRIFDSIINGHIDKKRNNNTGGEGTEDQDLLDVLIRVKESGDLQFPITNSNIKAVILEIFGAGTDTSSTTIEWAMAELVRNPRVMEKAQDELRQALKGKEIINESDIKELGYLQLVIKETLGLHPPPVVLLLPRECREESEIGGYTIPLGRKVIINAWAIGRDPDYWNDAEIFNPERFENSSVDFLGSNLEYVPFGAGRRMCPGMAFGLVNVEVAAHLLYHFNWNLPDGKKPSELDMSERFGAAVSKKHNLHLLATPFEYSQLAN